MIWDNYFRSLKKRKRDKTIKRIASDAEDLFQVAQIEGELWLVYANALVAPMSYIAKCDSVDGVVSFIGNIRELYIKRKIKELYG